LPALPSPLTIITTPPLPVSNLSQAASHASVPASTRIYSIVSLSSPTATVRILPCLSSPVMPQPLWGSSSVYTPWLHTQPTIPPLPHVTTSWAVHSSTVSNPVLTNPYGHPFSSVADGSWPLTFLQPHHGSGLPPLPPSLWMVNIMAYVTTVLASVDDYLSWAMQFTSFAIMHQIRGMIDGTIPQSSSTILVTPGVYRPNPASFYWIRVDQLIRACIFATIFKETLCEVRNIPYALQYGTISLLDSILLVWLEH